MKQAIAGAVPHGSGEVASMTIWPSIGSYSLGRTVGKLSANRIGWGFFTLGKVLAAVTIPISLVAFACRLLPFVARRYTLTNQRVIVQKGLSKVEGKSIDLDEFDTIEVRVTPGQEFFHAGDVIFKRGSEEVLSLSGVSRPEPFRQVCLKAQTALLSVRAVLEQQTPND
jgi:PH (Pleckstrin Homology) domain-containing protein